MEKAPLFLVLGVLALGHPEATAWAVAAWAAVVAYRLWRAW